MTRAKSGLPSDDTTGNTTGLTSISNTSESAADLRLQALKIEQSIKHARRYETVTLTDLASWPAGSDVRYSTLPKSLKQHVRELHMWGELRSVDLVSTCNYTNLAAINLQFDQLNDTAHDRLATELRDIHTIILYTLHTQVLPEYTAFHTLGGEQTVHWESIAPGSDQCRKRQLVLDRMNSMQASSHVPGAQGMLLDYYDWGKGLDEIGTVHLLYRDLPGAKDSQKDNDGDDGDDDDDVEAGHRTATRSKSTRSIASGYVRAMHTAIIVLGREAHPRSIVCPLTSSEWQMLVRNCHVPEDLLQGHRVTPKFKYDMYDESSARCHELDFLKCRTADSFFRNLYIGHAYFAVRGVRLAAELHPEASLALLHKECKRVHVATANSSKASFDHCISVVNSLLQHSDDLFEPDSAAHVAIQLLWPTAASFACPRGGHMFSGEVRRQLALYHREMVNTARNRKNTIAVGGKLDPGGLLKKQAGGRLPKDLTQITRMRAQLRTQVWSPVWTKIQDWLRSQGLEASEQSYLSLKHLDTLGPFLKQHGLTDSDSANLRTLMCLELSFQRSQVWHDALCKEFSITEHESRKLYVFQLTRSFKRANSTSRGSLPASTSWPLSDLQSVLVHTLLHAADKPAERLFPKLTQQAVAKQIAKLGWNWVGIPRLGPHALRTYYTCEGVNNPDVIPADYPALGAHMQVSVDTLLTAYAAPSLRGPAAQLAFKLHKTADDSTEQQQQPEPPSKKQKVEEPARQEVNSGQQMMHQLQQLIQQQHAEQMASIQTLTQTRSNVVETEPALVPVKTNALYGRALNAQRLKYMNRMKAYFISVVVCTEEQSPATEFVKRVFHQLCDQRVANSLEAGAEWFDVDVTHFTDENCLPFANFIRKYWNKR
jgi:hypothetical protein